LCGLIVSLASAIQSSAEVLVVAPDGTGEYATINDALEAAQDGDVVELLDGTFRGDGNRDLVVLGAVTLRSRSGDPRTCIIDCEGSESLPHRGFVFESGQQSDTIVQGITIINAHAGTDGFGGAVLVTNGAPTIRSCAFVGNRARRGGAIASSLNFAGVPLVSDCAFRDNEARRGGAFYIDNSEGLVLEDCEVIGNRATSSDGGALSLESTYVILRDCVITGNEAFLEGGGIGARISSIELEGCTVSENTTADANAGGILLSGIPSSARLTRTILWGNCSAGEWQEMWVSFDGNADFICCDVDAGDVGGPGTIDYLEDNLFVDPLFCGSVDCESPTELVGDFLLQDVSPCLPDRSPCGQQIGALGEGCGSTPVRMSTWSSIKALYR